MGRMAGVRFPAGPVKGLLIYSPRGPDRVWDHPAN